MGTPSERASRKVPVFPASDFGLFCAILRDGFFVRCGKRKDFKAEMVGAKRD